jgi:hypothetical protein
MQDAHTFLIGRRQGALTLRSWLRSLAHRQHFPVADLRDPMPTIGYHALVLARQAAEVARRALRRDGTAGSG